MRPGSLKRVTVCPLGVLNRKSGLFLSGMSDNFLQDANLLKAGNTVKSVVSSVYYLIQAKFGKRDTEIFWLHDAGIKKSVLALRYKLTTSCVRQIISRVERYVSLSLSYRRLHFVGSYEAMPGGSLSAKQLLINAGYELNEAQLTMLVSLDAPEEDKANEPLKTELDLLGLDTRTRTALAYRNINTIEELCNMTREAVHILRGIGPQSIQSIERALDKYGFALKR